MVLMTEGEASVAFGRESLKITLQEYWKAHKTESFRLPMAIAESGGPGGAFGARSLSSRKLLGSNLGLGL